MVLSNPSQNYTNRRSDADKFSGLIKNWKSRGLWCAAVPADKLVTSLLQCHVHPVPSVPVLAFVYNFLFSRPKQNTDGWYLNRIQMVGTSLMNT